MFEGRIKHYITLRIVYIIKKKKKNNHCVNNDFPNTFLSALMRSRTLAGSPEI